MAVGGDDDPLFGGGNEQLPSLELVSVPPAKPAKAPEQVKTVVLGPKAAEPAATPPPPPGAAAPPPPSPAAPRAAPPPAREISALADFGPPPPNIFGAVFYTLHVQTRRKELRLLHADALRHVSAAEGAFDEALAALGRSVTERTSDGGPKEIEQELAVARAALEAAGDSRAALGREADERAKRKAQLERERDAVRRELGPWRDHETKQRTQLEVREADLARAKARSDRAGIELRNLRADPTRADPARVAMLEADVEARAQELRVAEQPVREITDALAAAKQELAVRLARMAQLDEDLAAIERAGRAGVATADAVESEAARAARKALSHLGRAVLSEGAATGHDPALGSRAEAAGRTLEERRRRADLARLAIDAYDRPSVAKGVAILASAAVLVGAMVLFILVRTVFG